MSKRSEKHFWPIALIIIILASLVGLFLASFQGLWFDEGYSILISQKSLADLIHFTSVDVHPPVYYLILKLWTFLFGSSELGLRFLSIFFFASTLIVLTKLLKNLFNTKIALVALTLTAFSPLLIRYSFEIRMYTLMSLIAVLATYILVKALQVNDQKRLFYILYAILVALGMLTHYYMVFVWLSHLVWLIYLSRKQHQALFKQPWLRAYILSVILFLPWLPIALRQISGNTLASVVQPMTLENMISVFSFSFVYQPAWRLDSKLSLVMLFILITVIYLVVKGHRLALKKYQPGYSLLLSYSLVPLIVMTVIGIVKPVFIERYIVPFMFGGISLVGVLIAINKKKPIILVTFLAVLLFGLINLGSVGNFNFQRMEVIRTKQMAEYINCQPNEAILTSDPYTYIQYFGYLGECNFYTISNQVEKVGGYAPVGESARIKSGSYDLDKYSKIYYIDYSDNQFMPGLLINRHFIKESPYGSMRLREFVNS